MVDPRTSPTSAKSGKRPRVDDSEESAEEGPARESLQSQPTGSDGDDGHQCVICLQLIVDRTVVPGCAHDRFCFECIELWTSQSRKCPLCQASIGSYLIHNIRSQYDFSKYHLPPLRTSPPPAQPLARVDRNGRVAAVRRRRAPPVIWGSSNSEEQDELDRAIERRKWVYRHDLYAKHVASNPYTRFKPYPTPAQFSASPDLISRTTAFVRRELRVWPNSDVEFLTSFILALMKSIDIRSESAIKLLSEFLDMDTPYAEDGRKRNAEHFAHELYTYLRSPYRDLNVYDGAIQYDKPADVPSPPEERPQERWVADRHAAIHSGPSSSTQYRHHNRRRSRSRSSSVDPMDRSPRDLNSDSEDRDHRYRRSPSRSPPRRSYANRSPGYARQGSGHAPPHSNGRRKDRQRSPRRSRSRYRDRRPSPDEPEDRRTHMDYRAHSRSVRPRSQSRPRPSARDRSSPSSSSRAGRRYTPSPSYRSDSGLEDSQSLDVDAPLDTLPSSEISHTVVAPSSEGYREAGLPLENSENAGLSIMGASSRIGFSFKGAASRVVSTDNATPALSTAGLPRLLTRMSDGGPTLEASASSQETPVADIMARTRAQLQAKRKGKMQPNDNDGNPTPESGSGERKMVSVLREHLLRRLEEERKGVKGHDQGTGQPMEVDVASSTSISTPADAINGEDANRAVLTAREAKLKSQARLRIKLASERRLATSISSPAALESFTPIESSSTLLTPTTPEVSQPIASELQVQEQALREKLRNRRTSDTGAW